MQPARLRARRIRERDQGTNIRILNNVLRVRPRAEKMPRNTDQSLSVDGHEQTLPQGGQFGDAVTKERLHSLRKETQEKSWKRSRRLFRLIREARSWRRRRSN